MPVMNVIKNDAYGNMLCSKIPCEDFNIGSQLIVAEYDRMLYAELEKDRIELAFLKGKKVCPNCGMELDGDIQLYILWHEC